MIQPTALLCLQPTRTFYAAATELDADAETSAEAARQHHFKVGEDNQAAWLETLTLFSGDNLPTDTEHVETAEQPAEKSTSVEAPPSDRDEVVPSDVAAIDAATRTNDGATTDALASTGSMEQGQHDSVISEVPAAESEEAGQEHHQQQQQGGEPASEEKEAHWASEAAAMNGESAAGVTAQDAVASEGGAMWQAESSAPESSFGASERGMRVLETASAAEAPEHHPAVVMTSEQAQEAMRLLAGVPAPRVADMTRSRSRSPSRGEHRAPLPVRERSPPVGAFAAGAYGGGQDAGAPKTENRVYVGNLSWDVHDSDLHDFMSEGELTFEWGEGSHG